MAKVVWTGADGEPREVRTSEYPVTMVTRRGRGWRNLHTFEFRHGEWVRATPRTARQGRQPERRGGSLHEPIPEGTVELTDKLNPQREHLLVILDALRGVGWHKVDVADISFVISQLGGDIAGLGELTPDVRRNAEPALCVEIIRRCTSIKN